MIDDRFSGHADGERRGHAPKGRQKTRYVHERAAVAAEDEVAARRGRLPRRQLDRPEERRARSAFFLTRLGAMPAGERRRPAPS